MSLNHKDKETLHLAILKLAKMINEMENTPIDPRVLDMLEICGSLLEQQIEMDIVFEQCNIHDMDTEVILFEDIKDNEVVHINFEEDKDIPSVEDLTDWFNIGD